MPSPASRSRAGSGGTAAPPTAVVTDDGFAALESAAPGHVACVRRALFDALTPDQVRQLGEISDAIVRGLTPDPALGRDRGS